MIMKIIVDIVSTLVFLCGTNFISFWIGRAEESNQKQREAVRLGHAEFVIVDPATGRTKFRWKERAK